MTFDIGKFLHLVESIAPLTLALTPLAPAVPFIILGIQTAEKISGASGAQKLMLAQQIVNAGVAGANAQAGHTILDPVLVSEATASGISAVVAAVNLAQNTPAKQAAAPQL